MNDIKYLDNLLDRVNECKKCSSVGFCWNSVETAEIIMVVEELKKQLSERSE